MTGNLLGDRYQMGDALGYGGMSEVYRGRDVRLGRDVAIKVLRTDLARDPTFQTRFRREAQHSASLNHPAIVSVYDTGEMTRDGSAVPYIVMEYIDGETLRDVVKREGPLAPARAMEISADIGAALDFSHRHGIVHRDVKPANVMLTRAGAVKVMDFGIARAATDGQSTVTATAAVIGTAQYLSPEQARGEQVDARSDVYAAGCVLYELLTGDPPFTGDSPVAVAYQHVREDPKPPSTVQHGISKDLDAIVLKALNKNPMNRYQTAAEMRSDLVRALSGQSVHATPVMDDRDRTEMLQASPAAAMPVGATAGTSILEPHEEWEDDDARNRRVWGFVGIGLICLLLLGGAVYLTLRITGAPPPATQVATPSLIGKTPADAAALARENQLVVAQPLLTAPSSPEKEGLVIDQNPSEGVPLDQGAAITLTIGTGVETVSVPNVQGMKPNRAQAEIEKFGLHYDEQKIYSNAAKGNVAKQDPPPQQEVEPGSTVTVFISQGAKMTTIPDKSLLVGVPLDQATAALEAAELKWVPQTQPSDKPKDEVLGIGGGLAPGDAVQVDTIVTLLVSDNSRMTMPPLVNMTPEDALNTLMAEDLGWTGNQDYLSQGEEASPNRAQWGLIISQLPKAGELVPKDALIHVKVAVPPAIPDLSGMTREQVLQALKMTGWQGELFWVIDRGVAIPPGKAGTVIPNTQDPAYGEKVPTSGPVTVHAYPSEPENPPPDGGGGDGHDGGGGGGNNGGDGGGGNGGGNG